MAKINLLDTLPKVKRPIDERAQVTDEDRRLSWKIDREYFDGTRAQGLGGYYYDGRWKTVVRRMIEHYDLKPGARILDVGCAKGFLLHDFLEELPGAKVAGIDISNYALREAWDKSRPYVYMANGKQLPFASKSFDLVVSINSLHNILKRDEVVLAMREIERVGRGAKFVSLGAYANDEEKARLDKWAVVATTYLHQEEWLKLFAEAGYTGDHFWFNP